MLLLSNLLYLLKMELVAEPQKLSYLCVTKKHECYLQLAEAKCEEVIEG